MALSFFPALTRSLAFSVSRSIISSSCSHRQQSERLGLHASQGIPQHLMVAGGRPTRLRSAASFLRCTLRVSTALSSSLILDPFFLLLNTPPI